MKKLGCSIFFSNETLVGFAVCVKLRNYLVGHAFVAELFDFGFSLYTQSSKKTHTAE